MKQIEIDSAKTQAINFRSQQWVQSKDIPEIVILTTGGVHGDSFSGMAMPCKMYPKGVFSENWTKEKYRLLTDEIPFIISNS